MNEFELIKQFTAPFGPPPSPRGPGDDCAVLPASPASVVTTDTLQEGVHFLRKTFSLGDIGHKALAVNLSDLASMGATPSWFVCSLSLTSELRAADVRALARGMAPLARAHGIELVGGNVTRALQLSITITAAGTAKRPLLRSGASPGDLLCVSGHLGEAGAGLEVLGRSSVAGPLQGSLVRAQRRPQPQVEWGQLAARYASAAIDVSDGLAQDLGHLCKASGVGAALQSTALPLSDALLAWAGSRAKALKLALSGGEDYVVLAAIPPKRRAAFERALARKALRACFIGEVLAGAKNPRHLVTLDGRPSEQRTGFMHFR
jgi:thiamine-monophosphate kinase